MQAGVAILTSDRLQSKESYQGQRHYILIKGPIHKENIAVLDVCMYSKQQSFKIHKAKTDRIDFLFYFIF